MNSTYRSNLKAIAQANKNYTDTSVATLQNQLDVANAEIANLKQSASGNTYTKSVISGTANTITLDSNILPTATLDKVGGMSYKATNLMTAQKTINLTAGSEKWMQTVISGLTIGNTYTIKNFKESESNEVWQIPTYGYQNFTTNAYTFTATYDYVTIRCGANTLSASINYESQVMLVKGSTAPSTYQPYFTGLRHSQVTSIPVSNGNTYTMPSSITSLDGYGMGVNSSVYNYIDLVNAKTFQDSNGNDYTSIKSYVKNVGIVDLGTLNWSYDSNNRFTATISDIKTGSVRTTDMLCALYTTLTGNETFDSTWDMVIYNGGAGNYTTVYIHNSNYTDTDTFTSAMSGVYLVYPLATPVETDISNYIGDLGLLNNVYLTDLEGNGTITFDNTYNQDVPYQITTYVKVV